MGASPERGAQRSGPGTLPKPAGAVSIQRGSALVFFMSPGLFSMALQKQKITRDQLHQLIQERFGLTIFFQISEDRRLGFRTTVVAAPEDLYELHSRLERICTELRPKFELVAERE